VVEDPRSPVGDRAKAVRFRVNGMTNWHALAKASGFGFSDADLDRIAPVLSSLEAAFMPLEITLDYTTEPAVVLSQTAVRGGISGAMSGK
jgi:hypothetical protein